MKERTRIKVQKKSENKVQKLGARYDGRMKSWYVPEDISISLFSEFIPLTVELVPASSWNKNVRSELKASWDDYRRQSYRNANHTCEICGTTGERMESHEIWLFNNKKKIQKLEKLICLCHKCHRTKHWGLALIKNEGDMVKKHIMKINQWKIPDVEKYIEESLQVFEQRSRIDWSLDLSSLPKL